MKYLTWNEAVLNDFSPDKVGEMYEKGFVFTRLGKGIMHQTRSVRIDLSKFVLSSENRRVLKKTEGMILSPNELPLTDYDFSLGKLAKDFYENKFGPGIMSAQKIKEMLTDASKSNFNSLLSFSPTKGYVICYADTSLLHYSYPFYDLANAPKDMGLGMMIRAVQYAKEKKLKYIYLGSLQRPADVYKLQFEGLQWFDGSVWQDDIEPVKKILASANMEQ